MKNFIKIPVILTALLFASSSIFASNTLENGTFEDFVMIDNRIKEKTNKQGETYNTGWASVKMNGWKYTYANDIHKDKEIDFSKFDMNGLSKIGIYKNSTHFIKLDSHSKMIEAIYQEFETDGEDRIYFDIKATKEGTSDVELYIDGKYVKTISPSKKVTTYFYRLDDSYSNHSILFKEVNEQNDGKGTYIDNVILGNTPEIHKELLNGQFEERSTIKDNKKIREDKNGREYLAGWEKSNVKYWNSINGIEIEKGENIDFDKFETVGEIELQVNKLNRGHLGLGDALKESDNAFTGYQMELDGSKNSIDAIYQEFKISEEKILMFDTRARKVNTSDIELYIDGKYIKTITPNKKYSTYIHDKKLSAGIHTILFKEVNGQDNGVGALIDNVKVISEKEIRKELPNKDNKIAVKAYNIIINDEGLKEKVIQDEILDAVYSSNQMADLIYNAIKELNLGKGENGYTINEMKQLNTYMFNNHHEEMVRYHGDNGKTFETGYHLIQNDGATTVINLGGKDRNAINTVIDSFYHFGLYETVNDKRILNEDGNKNASWRNLAKWANETILDL